MSDAGLYIAASGIQAQTIALDSASEDLSNVGTSGYDRQRVNLSPLPGGAVGSGVTVTSVQNISNALLDAQALSSTAASSAASSLSQVLSTVQAAFPEPSSSGLQAQLSSFWSSWDTLGNDPTNAAAGNQVIDAAQNIATGLNTASQALSTATSDTTQQIDSTVSNDNQVLARVAQLNSEISNDQASGGSPTLVDQRNALVSQLAKDLGVTTMSQSNGSVSVYLQGNVLVEGGQAQSLTPTSAGQVDVSSSGGAPTLTPGGSVGGLAASLSDITSFQAQLNSVASSLASTVNTQLQAGYYYTPGSSTGTPGVPLFVSSGGGASVNAADISLNPSVVANPSELAVASSATAGPNDGSNAQAIAELASTPTDSSGNYVVSSGPLLSLNGKPSPDALYRSLVGDLGTVVQNASTTATATSGQANVVTAAQQAVEGVDPNQEMVQMLAYQNAYQASAKVLSTVQTTIQSLLAAV